MALKLTIDGANTAVELNTEADQQSFIDSVAGIVARYGLNGIGFAFSRWRAARAEWRRRTGLA